jgi:hypothetical protein
MAVMHVFIVGSIALVLARGDPDVREGQVPGKLSTSSP